MATEKKYEIWQPFLLSVMVVIGMLAGIKMDTGAIDLVERVKVNGSKSPIGRVEEVIRFIETKYVDSLDSDAILESAIKKIMEDLDPHSIYLSPEQLSSINDQMNGYYRGIGVESFFIDDTVRISRVFPGSPADEAGVRPFDKLIAISDTIVAGMEMDYSEIRAMLKADDRTELNLKIMRGNPGVTVDLTVVPSAINLQSSKVAYLLEDDIAYIKVDRFSSNTYKEFMESLEFLVDKKQSRHLIIDLRDNPGGYLPETVNIISQLFNDKGRLIVYTKGKDGKRIEYKTTGKNFFPIDRIAILINEGSASGSEIIAGAIQDWDRGIIIGRRSFGKGLVQEQYPLKNGGAIRLTISRYYTPSGRSIQKPYNDLNDYKLDIATRYHDDEIFGEGIADNQDSTIYFTQLLRRMVYGRGGITPDVYIPVDSSISIPDRNTLYSYIPEFVFLQRGFSNDQDLSFSAFEAFVVSKGLDGFQNLKIDPMDLEIHIRAELAYQQNGEVQRDSILNSSDPFILNAIEYLHSENTLKDYPN